MDDHVCDNEAEIKEMNKHVQLVYTDVALIKRDVTDLKAATIQMSGCIRTLTEASIVSQQNTVTREKFYEKLEELGTLRTQALVESNSRVDLAKKEMDMRINALEKITAGSLVTIEQFAELRKWVMGIAAAIVLFVIFEGYRLVIK